MITITELARDKIRDLIEAQGKADLALRFGIRGRGQGGFLYRLAFVDASERVDTDQVIDAGGLTVFIDEQSAPSLAGTTIDFLEGRESGFKIDNPNPLWADPVAVAVQQVIDTEINPAVATHGGHVTLIDVQDNTAYVQLGGGCQGCGMVDVTLKQGITVRIRELVPQIVDVVDTTDHAQGKNPFYQPAKGGGGSSPYGQ